MREVELKFGIAPREVERLRRCAPLRGIRPRKRSMLALYLDTPDEMLAARGMALRLRREGRQWVQAFKAGGGSAGGLHARDEWERASPDGALDLASFCDTPLAALPGAERLHERLTVLFQVEVQRTTWLVKPARGVKLEVALDVGTVRHDRMSDAIREVEIERKAGPDEAVFDLARSLLDQVPLVPSAVTKAQRGYRLVRGERPQPAHAQIPPLDRAMTLGQGAAHVLAAGLAQLLANAEGVSQDAEPEFVHQLRVSLRRIRSALRVFARALGKSGARELRKPLRNITTVAGRARDLDVFASRTLPAIAHGTGMPIDDPALARRLHAARGAAHRRLAAALASSDFARAVLGLARMLHRAPSAHDHRALRRHVAARLDNAERGLRRASSAFETLDPSSRHRMRIRAKRLRYALEACGGLFPHRPVKRYAAALSALQDALGEANDARVGQELLERLRAPQALAQAGAAWLAQQEANSTRAALSCLEVLRRVRTPWRKR